MFLGIGGWYLIYSIKRYKVDTLNRAGFGTLAASRTLVIVYLCAEVFDLYCAEFARLNTFHTAYAAV